MMIARTELTAMNAVQEWSIKIGPGQVVDVDALIPGAPEGVTVRSVFAPVDRFFDEMPVDEPVVVQSHSTRKRIAAQQEESKD